MASSGPMDSVHNSSAAAPMELDGIRYLADSGCWEAFIQFGGTTYTWACRSLDEARSALETAEAACTLVMLSRGS